MFWCCLIAETDRVHPSSVAANLWIHHDSSDHLGAQGGTNDPRLLGGFPRCLGTRRCQSPRSRCQWNLEIGTGAPNPMVYHGLSWFIIMCPMHDHMYAICWLCRDINGILLGYIGGKHLSFRPTQIDLSKTASGMPSSWGFIRYIPEAVTRYTVWLYLRWCGYGSKPGHPSEPKISC